MNNKPDTSIEEKFAACMVKEDLAYAVHFLAYRYTREAVEFIPAEEESEGAINESEILPRHLDSFEIEQALEAVDGKFGGWQRNPNTSSPATQGFIRLISAYIQLFLNRDSLPYFDKIEASDKGILIGRCERYLKRDLKSDYKTREERAKEAKSKEERAKEKKPAPFVRPHCLQPAIDEREKESRKADSTLNEVCELMFNNKTKEPVSIPTISEGSTLFELEVDWTTPPSSYTEQFKAFLASHKDKFEEGRKRALHRHGRHAEIKCETFLEEKVKWLTQYINRAKEDARKRKIKETQSGRVKQKRNLRKRGYDSAQSGKAQTIIYESIRLMSDF